MIFHPVEFQSPLVTRKVNVGSSGTSLSPQPDLWEALREIAARENWIPQDICCDINKTRDDTSLTSAMAVYLVNYSRAAAKPS